MLSFDYLWHLWRRRSSVSTVWQRHRGPYTLRAERALTKRGGAFTLIKNVATEDVEDMARMLLDDPRDNVLLVCVWSEREEQYVTSFRKQAQA